MADGDGDRAAGLMPSYDELLTALECPRVDEKDGRAAHDRTRAETWAKARVWKKRRPRVRAVEPQQATTKDVDEELGRCRTRLPFAMQTIGVTVELDGGGHGQFDVDLTAVKLGSRWFLMDAGEVPIGQEDQYKMLVAERKERRDRRERAKRGRRYDADDFDFDSSDDDDEAADKSVWAAIGGPSSAVVAKVRALRDETCACQDLECLERADRALELFTEVYHPPEASDDEHRNVQAILDERLACVRAVRQKIAPSTGVPACDEYVRYIEWYMSCDKIPQAARDGMQQGIDAMKQAWGDVHSMPDEARDQMADSCRAAVDALRQAADAMGCGTMP
jgi:hypothetical protein